MKILIVEDDNDLREITTHSLEKERYVVTILFSALTRMFPKPTFAP